MTQPSPNFIDLVRAVREVTHCTHNGWDYVPVFKHQETEAATLLQGAFERELGQRLAESFVQAGKIIEERIKKDRALSYSQGMSEVTGIPMPTGVFWTGLPGAKPFVPEPTGTDKPMGGFIATPAPPGSLWSEEIEGKREAHSAHWPEHHFTDPPPPLPFTPAQVAVVRAWFNRKMLRDHLGDLAVFGDGAAELAAIADEMGKP